MKKSEKIALALGATFGALVGTSLLSRVYALREENSRLKVDNINLLRNALVALDALASGERIPGEIINDLEFRRMAFVAEFEDIEDEPNG